jgi:hypothetical protein
MVCIHTFSYTNRYKDPDCVTTASERTLKEFLSIYDRAGLRLVKVHSLRSWVSIMELAKK